MEAEVNDYMKNSESGFKNFPTVFSRVLIIKS